MAETFQIVPAQTRPLWLVIFALVVIFAAALAIFAVSSAALSSRKARFEISTEGLRLYGDMYGRLIPMSRIRVAEARPVNVGDGDPLEPRARTMGTTIPGYRAGWFRLRNGTKGLLYVTDPSHVAAVPTMDGYTVLLSVANPQRFVEVLRRAASDAGKGKAAQLPASG